VINPMILATLMVASFIDILGETRIRARAG
jgi:hypothetical protein